MIPRSGRNRLVRIRKIIKSRKKLISRNYFIIFGTEKGAGRNNIFSQPFVVFWILLMLRGN